MLYQIQKHFFEPLLSPIFQDFYVILILHTTLPSKRILLSGMKKKALNQSQYLSLSLLSLLSLPKNLLTMNTACK